MNTVISIQQVRDGEEYKGTIYSTQELMYTIRFTVPIPELDAKYAARKARGETLQSLFPISVKCQGKEVELNEKQYVLLFSLLAPFAANFFNNPQTRSSNAGVLGRLTRGENAHPFPQDFATITLSTKTSFELDAKSSEVLTGLTMCAAN